MLQGPQSQYNATPVESYYHENVPLVSIVPFLLTHSKIDNIEIKSLIAFVGTILHTKGKE